MIQGIALEFFLGTGDWTYDCLHSKDVFGYWAMDFLLHFKAEELVECDITDLYVPEFCEIEPKQWKGYKTALTCIV